MTTTVEGTRYTPFYDKKLALAIYHDVWRAHENLQSQTVLPWGQYSSDNDINRAISQRHRALVSALGEARDELRRIIGELE